MPLSPQPNFIAKTEHFDELVQRHLRTVTDKGVDLTEADMDELRSNPRLWWATLVQRKKAVETQLASRNAELRQQKAEWRRDRESFLVRYKDFKTGQTRTIDDLDEAYARWRSSSLRFKNVVEQVQIEVSLLLRETERDFMKQVLTEERNMLANRVRELEDAIIDLSVHVCGDECGEHNCTSEDYLYSLVKGAANGS